MELADYYTTKDMLILGSGYKALFLQGKFREINNGIISLLETF